MRQLKKLMKHKIIFNQNTDKSIRLTISPAQRAMEQALPVVQGAALAGGLLLLVPNALPVIAISSSVLVSAEVAASSSKNRLSSNKMPVLSDDEIVAVSFESSIFEANS